MDLSRHQALQLAAAHDLDEGRTRALLALAGLGRPPDIPPRAQRLASATIAALLAGLGLVFLVAANWHEIGRHAKFGGLGGIVLLAGLVAWARPGTARTAAALLCFLAGGALLALIGQTYQTGADPWQLFALWAVLTLPLALAARSDALWSGWAIVACTTIGLWLHAWSGQRWFFDETASLAPQLAAWLASVAVAGLLHPALAPRTGAGPWAFRIAVLLAALLVTSSALTGLFASQPAATYPLGLLLLAAGAGLLSRRRLFDLAALSLLALAIDTLLVCGFGRFLMEGIDGKPIAAMLVLGLIATGVLAASVTALMRLRAACGGSDD
ncbi:MAG TPA: DUF2157 domain-containing protein [Chiayiivirga sp.]|nr:DUF2157 domain-containing protein [Chiayiivirga sp.]